MALAWLVQVKQRAEQLVLVTWLVKQRMERLVQVKQLVQVAWLVV